MAQSHRRKPSTIESPNRSPVLEALYQDLDAFIHELTGDGGSKTEPLDTSFQLDDDAASHDDSAKDLKEDCFQESSNEDQTRESLCPGGSDEEDDYSSGYSPLLENYSGRPFSEILPNTKTTVDDDDEEEEEEEEHGKVPSPPFSPSMLSVAQALPRSPTNSVRSGGVYATTTRSSSLANQHQLSAPTSPLNSMVQPSVQRLSPLERSNRPEEVPGFPNHAFISELGEKFVLQVRELNKRRRMFCTVEYPASFTGEEAVQMIQSILPGGTSHAIALQVARAFVRTSPPLVSAISYSEKSLKRNTLYESAKEIYTLNGETADHSLLLPQGVFTPLTPCYTQFCLPGQGGCYAPCCPNRLLEAASEDDKAPKRSTSLDRQSSLKSGSSSHDTTFSRSWSATVPREVLQNTPESEIKRQEAIHEIIYTEEDYVRDLRLLDELFAQPLRAAQCLDPRTRDEFCDYVFNNYKELLDIHCELCRELRDYQSERQSRANGGGFIDKVGDIFLKHLPKFMAAYSRYGPHVVLAEYAVKKESSKNMLFQNFIHDTEKQAECRKLPFRHFLILPVTRLQRYPLLLGAILKKTPEDHPDKEYLERCSEILRQVAQSMDEKTEETKMRLRLYEIDDAIRYKPGEEASYQMLQLRDPCRRLLHEGPLTRRSHMGVDTIDLHVFLFDHLFLMTKPRKVTGGNALEYYISKRPIPLELLHVPEATEGFAVGMRSMSSTSSTTGYSSSSAGAATTTITNGLTSPTLHLGTSNSSVPFLVNHLGRNGGDYLLFAENAEVRLTWKEKIVKAKAALEESREDQQVFVIRSLSDTAFAGTGAPSGATHHGKVTCSIPFEGANGIRMIAVGTNMGVYVGVEGDANSIRQVLALSDVTQMAVLEEQHILVVLADKTLYAYALQAMDRSNNNSNNQKQQTEYPFQKIAQHISYFHAGVCNNRTLVVAMKRRGMDSHFRAYEPVCGDLRDPKNAKFLTVKTGLFMSKQPPPWFRVYKEFYIGAESFDVHLLKARVVVVCVRGFEIIDPEHLTMNRNLPDMSNSDFSVIQQRGDDIRPLGMFRCGGRYLLCYNAFAFLVDNHGGLVKDSWIEWEGTPQSVAFCYPYVIAFDPRFIEVRHAETGKLIQVLAGEHMRCLQFTTSTSTGLFSPVIHGCMAHPFKPGYQYVFQLVGTFRPPA